MKKDEDPLMFGGIPHILCTDPIDIKDAEEIEYKYL